MKYYITFILLVFNPINFIADRNKQLHSAQEAYQKKAYQQAVNHYTYLVESHKIQHEKLFLNLAHSYFQLKKWEGAYRYYQKTLEDGHPYLHSIALQQLGLLLAVDTDTEQALAYFKEAIQKDPLNYTARYNYELLKKRQQKDTPKKSNKFV